MSKATKIKFPRGVEVDINNVPQNFDDLIRESFKGFTEETSKDYTYQDKLYYIDLCRKYLHHAEDAKNCVRGLIKGRMEYEEVSELGEVPDKDDFLSVEFMSVCFDKGRTNLYAHYTENPHIDDKIMELLVRVIKVVINYEPKEEG